MPGLKILLSGMVAGVPGQGGAVWAVLQYLLGFQGLGHDVFFLESVPPDSLRPAGANLDSSSNAHYFRQLCQSFQLEGKAALLESSSRRSQGADYRDLERIASGSDLLVNLSGNLRDENLLSRPKRRLYIDLDPAFTQLWHSVEGFDMGLEGHDAYATVGPLIGAPGCRIPCSRSWIATLPPVALDFWQPAEAVPDAAYTTVGNWRGYGSIRWNGVLYGQRAHSFRRFLALPQRCSVPFRMALAIHPEETRDLQALVENGWDLLDPDQEAATPEAYRNFIVASRAELGIAKSGYAASRCGWFSDRSVCYLASGRPVVAQETGFSDFLPTGEGLFAFDSVEGAAAAIESVEADYPRHSRRAAEIARHHFDSRRVLSRLLELSGAVS